MVLEIKGHKYYPIGSWERNQHKFYNLLDRLHCEDEVDYESCERVSELLYKFDCNPRRNGVVYALYDDYKAMKEVIAQYGRAL